MGTVRATSRASEVRRAREGARRRRPSRHSGTWLLLLSLGEPELLLLDEPFGALDALTRLRMHQLLGELCARHEPAVLLVTHDADDAIELADRVLLLDAGKIALDLPVELGASRSRRSDHFLDYRDTLLSALGVGAPQPDAAAPPLDASALRTGRYPTRLERTA